MPRLRRLGIECALVLVIAFWTIEADAQTAGTSVVSAEVTKASQAGQPAVPEKADADSTRKDAAKAAAGGIPLKGSTNVRDYVNIQVVLLPRKQAERVFSKEIARHYAVVQVIIDNKSEDAAFVLHSIFADYAGWALSGVPSAVPSPSAVTAGSSSSGDLCSQERDNAKAAAYQTVSCAGQVASVESRVIRGELQDASTWTLRNGLIRAAVLVGAVAAGIPAFGSKNAVKYVGAYNGQLVPGMEVFWPDGTIPQLNHVSDFGFQTNKIFAKGLSDPVYAFFPLDRFFTPGMKDIFLNAPAVFFAPAQIFVDKHVGKLQSQVDEMKNLIEDLVGTIPLLCDESNAATYETGTVTSTGKACFTQKQRDEAMLKLLTMDCSATKTGDTKMGSTKTGAAKTSDTKTGDVKTDDMRTNDAKTVDTQTDNENAAACTPALAAQKLLNAISLNSANILVQGVMTVNVAIVPATITDITFDEGNDSPDLWTVTGKDHAATITGGFLTGGVPSVTSIEIPTKPSAKIGDYLDSTKLSVVSDGSTDTKLNFKIQWKTQIPTGSKLHFQVTKYDSKDTKKTSGVKSMDYVFAVNYVSGKPSISNITVEKGDASATWAAKSTLTGNITGSALETATPTLTSISVPSDESATVGK